MSGKTGRTNCILCPLRVSVKAKELLQDKFFMQDCKLTWIGIQVLAVICLKVLLDFVAGFF